MKLTLTRTTAAGVLSVEEDLAGPQHAVDVVRMVESAMSTAEADIASRHAPADPPANHAPVIVTGPSPGPACAPVPPPGRFVPCHPDPISGEDLWKWAYEVGACKRVLAVGKACKFPAGTRHDVFRWTPDEVAHVYHEIRVKPAKGPR